MTFHKKNSQICISSRNTGLVNNRTSWPDTPNFVSTWRSAFWCRRRTVCCSFPSRQPRAVRRFSEQGVAIYYSDMGLQPSPHRLSNSHKAVRYRLVTTLEPDLFISDLIVAVYIYIKSPCMAYPGVLGTGQYLCCSWQFACGFRRCRSQSSCSTNQSKMVNYQLSKSSLKCYQPSHVPWRTWFGVACLRCGGFGEGKSRALTICNLHTMTNCISICENYLWF